MNIIYFIAIVFLIRVALEVAAVVANRRAVSRGAPAERAEDENGDSFTLFNPMHYRNVADPRFQGDSYPWLEGAHGPDDHIAGR